MQKLPYRLSRPKFTDMFATWECLAISGYLTDEASPWPDNMSVQCPQRLAFPSHALLPRPPA